MNKDLETLFLNVGSLLKHSVFVDVDKNGHDLCIHCFSEDFHTEDCQWAKTEEAYKTYVEKETKRNMKKQLKKMENWKI